MKGVSMKLRTGGRRRSRWHWLDERRAVYASRILPIDPEVAASGGRLMAERSRPVVDTMIAATVRVHNKIVVTRNVANFADTA
jgi:hypothetical protein